MPTGYTAKLMEGGQTFSEFALLCARAMGACVMLRDEPLDSPIPVFKPSDYSLKSEKKAEEELSRLTSMSSEEVVAFDVAARKELVEQYESLLAKETEENARLLAMREKVSAWKPPTQEHDGLKEFMLEQIDISANKIEYIEKKLGEHRWASAGFYEEAVIKARRDIEYQRKSYRDECSRVEARNRWIGQLKASLAPEA